MTILPYIQIILSILLLIGILLQRSEAGLGAAFGMDSMMSTHHTRRGLEKTLYHATIIVSILFVASVMASLFAGK